MAAKKNDKDWREQGKAPETIRIDPEVWLALQKLATPLSDTPNAVIRRLLGLDKPQPPKEGQ